MKNKDIEGLVFLEFNKPADSNLDTKQERHPQYFGINVAVGAVNTNKISSFDLVDPNNPIVKVNGLFVSGYVVQAYEKFRFGVKEDKLRELKRNDVLLSEA